MNAEVLEKLKKILTLANDRGATKGEVEAALGKAKEFAMRYNIDLASVELGGDEKKSAIEVEKSTPLKTRSKYRQPYHRWIYHVLEGVFGVKIITSGHSTYNGHVVSAIWIIGEPVDVAISVAMFPYLEAAYPAICNRLISTRKIQNNMAAINGCYAGITQGILEMNKREEAALPKAEAGAYAMVVRRKEDAIDEAMKQMFPNLRKGRKSSLTTNAVAAMHGYQAGKKINLRQVSGAGGQGQIK